MVSYYSIGLLKYNVNLAQESNESNRDIAGMDVYGAIRALHNPEMNFKRYIDYERNIGGVRRRRGSRYKRKFSGQPVIFKGN